MDIIEGVDERGGCPGIRLNQDIREALVIDVRARRAAELEAPADQIFPPGQQESFQLRRGYFAEPVGGGKLPRIERRQEPLLELEDTNRFVRRE